MFWDGDNNRLLSVDQFKPSLIVVDHNTLQKTEVGYILCCVFLYFNYKCNSDCMHHLAIATLTVGLDIIF